MAAGPLKFFIAVTVWGEFRLYGMRQSSLCGSVVRRCGDTSPRREVLQEYERPADQTVDEPISKKCAFSCGADAWHESIVERKLAG